jgi:hypothetical protein
MKLNVHIERLVLEGLPVGGNDGHRVRAAVTAELERLIRAHGVSDTLHTAGAVPAMQAEELRIAVAVLFLLPVFIAWAIRPIVTKIRVSLGKG